MLQKKRLLFLLIILMYINIPAGLLTAQVTSLDTIDYDYSGTHEADNFNLMIAASKGLDSEIIRLLNKGAEINVESLNGATPLIFAVANNWLSSVNILLAFNPEINKETLYRETPLSISVRNQNMEIVEALIRGGADINKVDRYGATPLHYASIYGNFNMTDLLLYYEAGIDIKAYDGTTPLMAAVWSGYPDVADLLIQNGANMEARDNDGYTPFLIAAGNGDTLIMNLLLKEGVDLYEKNSYNYNALDLAIESEKKDAVEMLLEKGDQWTSPEKAGISPYKVASLNGNKEFILLLQKKDVAGKPVLKLDEVIISATGKSSSKDFYSGINISFREPLIKAGFFAGCDIKFWYTKVLLKSSENVYYQYFDKSSVLYAGIFKDFILLSGHNRNYFAVTASVAGGYSLGNKLKGTNIAPDSRFLIMPAAGIKMQRNKVNISAGLEYMKSEFYNNGPIWLKVGLSYSILLSKVHSPEKVVKWY